MTNQPLTIEGTDYRRATPSTEAPAFVVIARAYKTDALDVVAKSGSYRNATKRANELKGPRYGWCEAFAAVAA